MCCFCCPFGAFDDVWDYTTTIVRCTSWLGEYNTWNTKVPAVTELQVCIIFHSLFIPCFVFSLGAVQKTMSSQNQQFLTPSSLLVVFFLSKIGNTQHNRYYSAKNLIQFSCFCHGWISFEISTYFQGKQKEESSSQQQYIAATVEEHTEVSNDKNPPQIT